MVKVEESRPIFSMGHKPGSILFDPFASRLKSVRSTGTESKSAHSIRVSCANLAATSPAMTNDPFQPQLITLQALFTQRVAGIKIVARMSAATCGTIAPGCRSLAAAHPGYAASPKSAHPLFAVTPYPCAVSKSSNRRLAGSMPQTGMTMMSMISKLIIGVRAALLFVDAYSAHSRASGNPAFACWKPGSPLSRGRADFRFNSTSCNQALARRAAVVPE